MSTHHAEQAKRASQIVAEARQTVPELTVTQAKQELDQGTRQSGTCWQRTR